MEGTCVLKAMPQRSLRHDRRTMSLPANGSQEYLPLSFRHVLCIFRAAVLLPLGILIQPHPRQTRQQSNPGKR